MMLLSFGSDICFMFTCGEDDWMMGKGWEFRSPCLVVLFFVPVDHWPGSLRGLHT